MNLFKKIGSVLLAIVLVLMFAGVSSGEIGPGCCAWQTGCSAGVSISDCDQLTSGKFLEGGACCYNQHKCYIPRFVTGCCDATPGGCMEGYLDAGSCVVCDGHAWVPGYHCCDDGNCHECRTNDHCPDGYICNPETHKCDEEVPEFPAGVTAVFGAALFIFLMMRRKYISK